MTDRENTAVRAGKEAEGHAHNVQESAASHAREVTDEAVTHAREVTDEAATQVRNVAEQGMSEIRHQADEQIDRAAEYLDDLGAQMRGMAAGEQAPDGVLADLVSQGADRIERFAGHLHSGGYEAALSDTRRFARRRPGMFLASAFGAGLAIGRVLRNTDLSSLTESHDGAGDRDGGRAEYDPLAPTRTSTPRTALGAPAVPSGAPAAPSGALAGSTGPAAARGPR